MSNEIRWKPFSSLALLGVVKLIFTARDAIAQLVQIQFCNHVYDLKSNTLV